MSDLALQTLSLQEQYICVRFSGQKSSTKTRLKRKSIQATANNSLKSE